MRRIRRSASNYPSTVREPPSHIVSWQSGKARLTAFFAKARQPTMCYVQLSCSNGAFSPPERCFLHIRTDAFCRQDYSRVNLQYSKSKCIRLSSPSLERPKKDVTVDKRTEYIDNADRVEVEWAFSLSKRNFGMGLIRTWLEGTTRSSIVLSIMVMNNDKLAKAFLCENLFWNFQGIEVNRRQRSCRSPRIDADHLKRWLHKHLLSRQ